MRLICDYCGRDLNEIYQDNMSYDPNRVMCEDCANSREVEEFDYIDYFEPLSRDEEVLIEINARRSNNSKTRKEEDCCG